MRLFLIVLGLIVAACAEPLSSRIVGGEATTIETYPFMAGMLRSSWDGGFFQACGGTLITTTSVVSAAHCFVGSTDSTLRVRLGATNSSTEGKEHIVSRIILHEQYNSLILINDIAVIKLRNAAVFSNKINIARIAGPRYILPDNTVVNAAGWGRTKFEGRGSEILKHVAVNIINHQICTDRFAYLKKQPGMEHIPDVTPEMLCTGILDIGGKDACDGDSGGPVVHNKDVLIGITSWGHECGHPLYPGVNVRVSSYTDWIYYNSLN